MVWGPEVWDMGWVLVESGAGWCLSMVAGGSLCTASEY